MKEYLVLHWLHERRIDRSRLIHLSGSNAQVPTRTPFWESSINAAKFRNITALATNAESGCGGDCSGADTVGRDLAGDNQKRFVAVNEKWKNPTERSLRNLNHHRKSLSSSWIDRTALFDWFIRSFLAVLPVSMIWCVVAPRKIVWIAQNEGYVLFFLFSRLSSEIKAWSLFPVSKLSGNNYLKIMNECVFYCRDKYFRS